MKISVRISDIEVIIDRPDCNDYNIDAGQKADVRENIMKDTVMPMLEAAVKQAQALYIYRQSIK